MSSRDEKLDLIRGLSAILVLVGHARNFIMVDSAQLVSPNIFVKLFYLLTSFHHNSVMIFFVLSGYFVGGSVAGLLAKDRFSWRLYSLARLSRLWLVLIPALLLTFTVDIIGQVFHPGAYQGEFREIFNSGPQMETGTHHGLLVLIGNLAFLQEIVLPVYGTNGPLWSLAFEFWYYALFPLIACALSSGGGSVLFRLCCLVAFCFLLWLLPTTVILHGTIWLFGVAVWIFSQSARGEMCRDSWIWKIIGGILFFSSVLADSLEMLPQSDYCVGFAFAIWMPSLLGSWQKPFILSKLSKCLSEISFSLYIIHFPIMFLVAVTMLRGAVMQPSFVSLSWFVGLNLACIATSVLFWLAFESRTQRVRRWLESHLGMFRNQLKQPFPH